MSNVETAIDSVLGRIYSANLLKQMPKQSARAKISVGKSGFSSGDDYGIPGWCREKNGVNIAVDESAFTETV